MKMFGLVILVLCLVVLSGCAAGPNTAVDTPSENGKIAGFWRGLWHGMISPITWIISLFSSNVHFYEVHNNGGWYNFGFIIGLSGAFGGGSSTASRKKSRRY